MELGDAAGWAAFAISAGALVVSYRAQRDGRKSAKEARLSRIASERSATVAEQQLIDQRREAAERRAAEEEASRPRPAFAIERRNRSMFYLRNTGTGPATGVAISRRGEPCVMDRIADVDLAPAEAVEFTMTGSAAQPIPGTLYVTWDGQDEEVPVAVPGL
ncbi:hypothetical protein [Streptomyces sp. wa1063]|uniref:hypothetical protein n=1 Tax=Streptomyces sp. wa1063 TaxID=1828212 RepID=UPI000BEF5F1D|nr:hypothetical protein [Streptomyces sp. wa1063]